jgi:hypothetical protein
MGVRTKLELEKEWLLFVEGVNNIVKEANESE